jgi:VanZ family protein
MRLLQFFIAPQYQHFRFRSAFLLYFAVLLLGAIPGARAEVGNLASGWVLHFAAYSCIALLLFTGSKGNASSKAFKTFLIIGAMGAMDEFVQSFFPYRTAAVTDWYVDLSAGFLTSALLCAMLPKKQA